MSRRKRPRPQARRIRPAVYRTGDVAQLLGVSPETVLRWRRAGIFPQPIQLGARVLAWPREDIEAWLKGRPRLTRRLQEPSEAARDA